MVFSYNGPVVSLESVGSHPPKYIMLIYSAKRKIQNVVTALVKGGVVVQMNKQNNKTKTTRNEDVQ